ncbi:LysE family translocator [Pseudomonas sp. 2835]|uniref:LysE family translocator n=1 Tax=Pseudomonas sp. 2835 TaxID=3156451 RepID=UPI003D24623D
MPNLLPFALFAFVASITPGPTNILILGHGARFGLRATLPLVLGACLSATLVLLLVGVGLGEVLLTYPRVQQLMTWLGVAWLTWLGWQLLHAGVTPLTSTAQPRDLGPLGAALLQAINPKVWLMAMAVIGLFNSADADPLQHMLKLSLLFLLIALPCMTTWALMGVGSARLLRSPQQVRRLNQLLALLLIASAWLAALG